MEICRWQTPVLKINTRAERGYNIRKTEHERRHGEVFCLKRYIPVNDMSVFRRNYAFTSPSHTIIRLYTVLGIKVEEEGIREEQKNGRRSCTYLFITYMATL